MDLKVLTTAVLLIWMTLVLALGAVALSRVTVAHQTRLRYWLTTWGVILAGAISVSAFVELALRIIIHSSSLWMWAVNFLLSILLQWIIVNTDEDDWFKDQKKKLKQRLRRMMTRSRVRPAPVS